MTDLDLFCCSGGATTGLAMLGRTVVGIDWRPAVAGYLAELYSQPLELDESEVA